MAVGRPWTEKRSNLAWTPLLLLRTVRAAQPSLRGRARAPGAPLYYFRIRWMYRVTQLLAEKVMLTSVPSQDNLGMSQTDVNITFSASRWVTL